jgi:hypothetical protein
MSEGKSFEQVSEEYLRNIMQNKGKMLDAFYLAYADQLNIFGKEFSLDDICLVEQHLVPSELDKNKLCSKYWFEYRPKFNE